MDNPEQRLITPGMLRPRSAEEFNALYAGTPPWDIGRPQGAFMALARSGAIQGRVLDVGCGTGEHVLLAAGLGLDATGIDLAERAIATAEAKARERHLSARFLIWNALELASLGETFDSVLDCGMFHVLEDQDRPQFEQALRRVVPQGGRYFLLCVSDRLPGDFGPRRITQDEIRSSFAGGWQVDAIEPSQIEVAMLPVGLPAWLATLTRL